MTAEETIQAYFDNAPMCFQTRDEVLNHLFCVGGNGFQWVDGRLVEKVDPMKRKKPLKKKKAHQYNVIKDSSVTKALLRDLPRSERWSPEEYLSGCYILNYPDNIKPDWLKLLKECQQMLTEDGIDLSQIQPDPMYERIHGHPGGAFYAT